MTGSVTAHLTLALERAVASFPIEDLEIGAVAAADDLADAVPEPGVRWLGIGGAPGGTGFAVVVGPDLLTLFEASGGAPRLLPVLSSALDRDIDESEVTAGRGRDELAELLGPVATLATVGLSSAGDWVATVVAAQAQEPGSDEDAGDQPGEHAPETAEFPEIGAEEIAAQGRDAAAVGKLGSLRSVEMSLTAELGRTTMTVRELLNLVPGAVVELDRTAGSPIDLLVNGTLFARGEVVVIDEEFGVRVSEIVSAGEGD